MICEAVHADVPWRGDVVQSSYTTILEGQIVLPHDAPGLGIEVDEDAIREHPYEPELLQRVFHLDGSVGDW